jgi:hypothetical protein
MPTIHFTDKEFENLLSFYDAKIDLGQRYIDKVYSILSRLKRVQKQQVIEQELKALIEGEPAIEPAKKRGRPRKVQIEIINKEVLLKAGGKRRGRPPKTKVEETNTAVTGGGLRELIFQKTT